MNDVFYYLINVNATTTLHTYLHTDICTLTGFDLRTSQAETIWLDRATRAWIDALANFLCNWHFKVAEQLRLNSWVRFPPRS
jgi:hypothetical protein